MSHILEENTTDCNVAVELGFPRLLTHLASSKDADVREATLKSLLELARAGNAEAVGLTDEEGKLRQVLQDCITDIHQMSRDDLGAAKEERQLVDFLWQHVIMSLLIFEQMACVFFQERVRYPQTLQENTLIPHSAWATPRSGLVYSSTTDKKESLALLHGPGPVTPSGNSEDN